MSHKGRWIAAGSALAVLVAVTVIWVTGGTARKTSSAPRAAQPPRALAPEYVSDIAVRRLRAAVAHDPALIWGRGSWCWFGDPRAVDVGGSRGETFVGWIDWHGRITIGEYAASRGGSAPTCSAARGWTTTAAHRFCSSPTTA